MTIGILEAGRTPPHLIGRYGAYADMMRAMIGPGFRATTYALMDDHWPDPVDAHDAYLITGSPAGVYDPFPWIERLRDFLRDLDGRSKLVGICFGHQIMADAFGGTVEKSHKGWGLGLHRYRVFSHAPWMDDAAAVAVAASHQDQVVAAPADAEVLGGSDFTPFAMLSYPARRAISFQFHPEFVNGFAAELVEMRRPGLADPAEADRALASLDQESDSGKVAGWIRRFLREA